MSSRVSGMAVIKHEGKSLKSFKVHLVSFLNEGHLPSSFVGFFSPPRSLTVMRQTRVEADIVDPGAAKEADVLLLSRDFKKERTLHIRGCSSDLLRTRLNHELSPTRSRRTTSANSTRKA